MNLLEEFCNQIKLSFRSEPRDVYHKEDKSGFKIIDGEESDFGIIKYYGIENDLLAVRTIKGGDDDDIEFTHWGVNLLKEEALNVFYNNLDSINIVGQKQ